MYLSLYILSLHFLSLYVLLLDVSIEPGGQPDGSIRDCPSRGQLFLHGLLHETDGTAAPREPHLMKKTFYLPFKTIVIFFEIHKLHRIIETIVKEVK
jgi:hypothetical protein